MSMSGEEVEQLPGLHFVGIGGYGMSGLARIYHQKGERVTGSDLASSTRTESLAAQGIPIVYGHKPEHVGEAEIVVFSTDVPDDNMELVEARRLGLTVLHRSELLARLINQGRGIAITGTHGKTTTTTLVGTLAYEGKLDPTVVVGGEVAAFAGNARYGQGEYVVAEADESDGSFLRYHPFAAVITNIEPEHLENYDNDFTRVEAAYAQFVAQVDPEGFIVACWDEPAVRKVVAGYRGSVIRYGLHAPCDIWADAITVQDDKTHFRLHAYGHELAMVSLAIPGEHNIKNALAAIAVALRLDIPKESILQTLLHFQNAKRRFQRIGEVAGVAVVDDYAHHPTEIKAVIRAARSLKPKRLLVLFQPQRFIRTFNFRDQFIESFDEADYVLLTEIYAPPKEKPIPGVSGFDLAERLAKRSGSVGVGYAQTLPEAVAHLVDKVVPGDLVLTLGAGDVYRAGPMLLQHLERG